MQPIQIHFLARVSRILPQHSSTIATSSTSVSQPYRRTVLLVDKLNAVPVRLQIWEHHAKSGKQSFSQLEVGGVYDFLSLQVNRSFRGDEDDFELWTTSFSEAVVPSMAVLGSFSAAYAPQHPISPNRYASVQGLMSSVIRPGAPPKSSGYIPLSVASVVFGHPSRDDCVWVEWQTTSPDNRSELKGSIGFLENKQVRSVRASGKVPPVHAASGVLAIPGNGPLKQRNLDHSGAQWEMNTGNQVSKSYEREWQSFHFC